jgi:ankyrin repeat protein
MTEALLASKADVNAEDASGSTALTYAASGGQARIVELLQKAGLKKGIDAAVAFAIRGCHLDIVRQLTANGASIKSSVMGAPAIVHAAGADCAAGVQMLLQQGVDVNAKADDGTTALIAAAERGLVDIGEILLAHGADMEVKNNDNQNAWLLAAMNNRLEFVELLRKVRDQK